MDRVFYFVDFFNNCIDEIINCDVDGLYFSCYSNWLIVIFIEYEDYRWGGRLNLYFNGCLKWFLDIVKFFKMEKDLLFLLYLNFYWYIIFGDFSFECLINVVID